MEISKVNSEDPDGIVAGSNKYEEEIHTIEIPQARTRTPNEPLAESEQSNLRLELGKLMWIARVARPGVMCDALAAAQTFSDGEMIDFLDKGDGILENGEKRSKERKSRRFWTYAWFY